MDIYIIMVKCRRGTIKKHGSKSYTVNLGGKAYYEVGSRSQAKGLTKNLKISEKIHCGKKISKKEAQKSGKFTFDTGTGYLTKD